MLREVEDAMQRYPEGHELRPSDSRLEILRVLNSMRKSFLQDVVFLMEKYPWHPTWKHKLFGLDLFKQWKLTILQGVRDAHAAAMTGAGVPEEIGTAMVQHNAQLAAQVTNLGQIVMQHVDDKMRQQTQLLTGILREATSTPQLMMCQPLSPQLQLAFSAAPPMPPLPHQVLAATGSSSACPHSPVADAGRSNQPMDESVQVQQFIDVVENKASVVKQDLGALWAAWNKGQLPGPRGVSLPGGLNWRQMEVAFGKKEESPADKQYRKWRGSQPGGVHGKGKFQMKRLRGLLTKLDQETDSGSAPEAAIQAALSQHELAIKAGRYSIITYSEHLGTEAKAEKNKAKKSS